MACFFLDLSLVDTVMQHRQDRLRVITKNLKEIANRNLGCLVHACPFSCLYCRRLCRVPLLDLA